MRPSVATFVLFACASSAYALPGSSQAVVARKKLAGPDPSLATSVTFAGQTFVNKGCAVFASSCVQRMLTSRARKARCFRCGDRRRARRRADSTQGLIPSDAKDSFGETLGGLGSAIAVKRDKYSINGDGTFSGVLVLQPDRGHNVEGPIDWQVRWQPPQLARRT